MKHLDIKIEYCSDCPFHRWDDDSMMCTAKLQVVCIPDEWSKDGMHVLIPEWCPLPDIRNTSELKKGTKYER